MPDPTTVTVRMLDVAVVMTAWRRSTPPDLIAEANVVNAAYLRLADAVVEAASRPFDVTQALRSLLFHAAGEADNVKPPGQHWTDDEKSAVEAFAQHCLERVGWLDEWKAGEVPR